MRLIIALAGAALFVVGTTSLAGADGDPVGDAREDNSGGGINRDLKGATHGHKKKLLKHGVSVYGKQISADGLVLHINTDRTPAANYVVRAEQGTVVRADGVVTGRIRLVAVSETKLRLLFNARAIGKPKAYGWFAAFEESKGGFYDRAPNAGYNKHRLFKKRR